MLLLITVNATATVRLWWGKKKHTVCCVLAKQLQCVGTCLRVNLEAISPSQIRCWQQGAELMWWLLELILSTVCEASSIYLSLLYLHKRSFGLWLPASMNRLSFFFSPLILGLNLHGDPDNVTSTCIRSVHQLISLNWRYWTSELNAHPFGLAVLYALEWCDLKDTDD